MLSKVLGQCDSCLSNDTLRQMTRLGSKLDVDAASSRCSSHSSKGRGASEAQGRHHGGSRTRRQQHDIRAILYSSDVRFEGLIYVSSQFHWRGDGKGTTQYIAGREYTRLGLCPCTSWRFSPDEHFIDNIVDAYAKAYPNLKVHDPDYPSPEELKSKIKWGNVDFDGDFSKDTDGSNLIKSLLLDDQPGPLYVTAQGGESTIARALKSIYDQYAKTPQWEAIREKVSRKLIIIPSGDQDGTDASLHPSELAGSTGIQVFRDRLRLRRSKSSLPRKTRFTSARNGRKKISRAEDR